MTREEALKAARSATTRTGRKHVVREDHGVYNICPHYELGGEGYRHDPGYAALGVLVVESLQ